MSTSLVAGMLFVMAGLGAVAPDAVEPLGETKARLEQAYGRLGAPPLDDPAFVLSDVSFHFVRRFTEYSGDVSGRMIGALNAGATVGITTPQLASLLKEIAAYQQPDGHFGAPQDLSKEVNQKRDMPILWGNARLLLALAERCRTNPDPDLLAVAKRLGDYIIACNPYYCRKENFAQVGGIEASGFTTCYPSWIDALVALGEVTKDARYLDEARAIARLSWIDATFLKHHSHGRLVAFRGMLDLDRLSGTPEFTDKVKEACAQITAEYEFPTGGVAEMFGRDFPRDEGCSEADWTRVNFLLWQATKDPKYLDATENVLFNHLYATQFSNGAFGHHTLSPLKEGKDVFPAARLERYASDSYWCCSMHGAQVIADVVHWGILFDDQSLWFTWLSEVRAKDPKGAFTASAERTGLTQWKVTLDAPKEVTTTLRLRVPGWAKSIQVDGKDLGAKDGWAEFPCTWTGQRTVAVAFPAEVRVAGAYAAEVKPGQPVRIYAGPDLYCLSEDLFVTENGLSDKMLAIAGTGALSEKGLPAAFNVASADKVVQLVPMRNRSLGPSRHLFGAVNLSSDALRGENPAPANSQNYIEFMAAQSQSYECFMNGKSLFSGGGTDESPRVAVLPNPGKNVYAVKVPGNAKQPGVIAQIMLKDRRITSNPADWQALSYDEDPPAEALSDVSKGLDHVVKITDLGGFGVAPWKHVPAHYASTPARWLWIDAGAAKKAPKWIIFRTAFDADGK